MSRIQDILARAERDGTARRTPAVATSVATPLASPEPEPAVRAPEAPLRTESAAPARPALVDRQPRPDATVRLDVPFDTTVLVTPEAAPDNEEAALPRVARPVLHPALVAAIEPHSTAAERYRTVRTRLLQREDAAALRTLLVTSPGRGDGKSVTAANLALTMGQELHRSVVLVDANLRDPAVHAFFGLEPGPGLSAVLAGQATLDEALVHLPDFNLTLLPGGAAPQFPTELLGSTAMRRTLDALRARFDRTLLDLPAVAPLADVGTVAPLADGVLLVVRAGVTQRPELESAVASFDRSRVAGIVLNDAV